MTYSIIARDPSTGELGVALQSRYFVAGRHVPWIEAGLGVVGRIDEAHEALRRSRAIHPGGSELLLRFADAGIISVPRQKLEPILAGL